MTTDITAQLQSLREAAARLLGPALEAARVRRLVCRNRKTGRLYAREDDIEALADAIADHISEEISK